MAKKLYAHSVEGKAVEEWHVLEEHLVNVAELARSFAAEFGCGEWERLEGRGMIWGSIRRVSWHE